LSTSYFFPAAPVPINLLGVPVLLVLCHSAGVLLALKSTQQLRRITRKMMINPCGVISFFFLVRERKVYKRKVKLDLSIHKKEEDNINALQQISSSKDAVILG
jgi:hypothetical protein